jgi:Lrp/AsnC family leucine-responsive transcriptional regulator
MDDSVDRAIVAEIARDGRATLSHLSDAVGLSVSAVQSRLRRLETRGVITGYRATVDLGKLGYGIRALIRIGRAEYTRVVKLVQQTPECINAYNVTGDDSWVLEIAVIDVAHLDAVVTRFCLLTETSTAIILNAAREHQPMLPARRQDIKPPIRKVANA